jgi:L-seryl-tRNA(Ser) seleniumtransferase
MTAPTNPLRSLPSVTEVLAVPTLEPILATQPRDLLVAAIRAELATLRQQLQAGEPVEGRGSAEAVANAAASRLTKQVAPKLRRVINATGIVLHTNLGRAPMAQAAVEAANEAASGYLNLELDLETGKRSSRQGPLREWVGRLTGAESATAVNNNAAATVLVLRALCQGREVIVSRGQLVEIGGSFRIPEIMAVSGAILREVGTTNITRLSDYANAIGPNTGALLRVHCSNYRIAGFTESVPLPDLVTLGQQRGLPVIDDVGSGALIDFARFGFQEEPVARDSISAGADVVLFSGDKLLGGPQAGIIAGKKALIDRVERDPLMRAFRLDKMTLAALEATLRLYLDEERALREVPILRMLATPLADLERRANNLAGRLRAVPGVATATPRADVAFAGGGSLPDQSMPTWVVELMACSLSDEELAYRLRIHTPAILGRLRDGTLVLDVRTVFEAQEPLLIDAVTSILAAADTGGAT